MSLSAAMCTRFWSFVGVVTKSRRGLKFFSRAIICVSSPPSECLYPPLLGVINRHANYPRSDNSCADNDVNRHTERSHARRVNNYVQE